jgi:hypothetical protein
MTLAEPVAGYTVRHASDDRLADGLDGRSPRRVEFNRNILKPLMACRTGQEDGSPMSAPKLARAPVRAR